MQQLFCFVLLVLGFELSQGLALAWLALYLLSYASSSQKSMTYYNENSKTLVKESNDLNKWKDNFMLMNLKNS
jgi:hypothetical protein